MWHASDLGERAKRRAFLGTLGAGLAAVIGLAPRAHADATLDATAAIVDAERDVTGDVGAVTVELTNHAEHPVQPVFSLWSVGRMSRMPWDVADGPDELPSGWTATYHLDAPGPARQVRLGPDKPALLVVFDRGSEARAHHRFDTGAYLD
jgi:hypothetical protein